MWHGAKHGTCSPRGHLQRVITPGSRRDNIQSQLSSYTQVCRRARLSADLRTQRAARWFLTRGWWQGGNLQFSLRVFSSLGAELQPGVGAETTGTLSCPYLDFWLLSLCEEKNTWIESRVTTGGFKMNLCPSWHCRLAWVRVLHGDYCSV